MKIITLVFLVLIIYIVIDVYFAKKNTTKSLSSSNIDKILPRPSLSIDKIEQKSIILPSLSIDKIEQKSIILPSLSINKIIPTEYQYTVIDDVNLVPDVARTTYYNYGYYQPNYRHNYYNNMRHGKHNHKRHRKY